MTSATKILLIEENIPIGFTIQNFLWRNGYFDTQIIPRNTSINTIQQLNPQLIIGTQNALNDIGVPNSSFPNYIVEIAKDDIPFEQQLACPVQQKEILTEIAKSTNDKKKEDQKRFLLIRQDNKLLKIAVPKILYLEAESNQITIYTQSGDVLSFNSSLIRMSALLPEACFMRIHKKYIVQVCLIESILTSDRKVCIQNHILPIGRTYKDELFSRFKIVN